MTDTCSIYLITNSINEKVYVGQTWGTIQHRFTSHKAPSHKGCVRLHNAFNKYGRDNFKIEILTTTDNQLTADCLETFWIKIYDSIAVGYNLREGGSQGKWSEEVKQKISASHKGIKFSEHHKQQLSKALKGRISTW